MTDWLLKPRYLKAPQCHATTVEVHLIGAIPLFKMVVFHQRIRKKINSTINTNTDESDWQTTTFKSNSYQ